MPAGPTLRTGWILILLTLCSLPGCRSRRQTAALPGPTPEVRTLTAVRERVQPRLSLFGTVVQHSKADVYVTSDLRHHVAGEFLEQGGPSLLDVSHWAAEWTWLPELAERLREALGDTVEIRVSTICTDVWQGRA